MRNFHNDQAAGLRRIMSAPRPRLVSILSAGLELTLPRMLTNLAASIQQTGNNVLIMHASYYSRESHYALHKSASLLDVCENTAAIKQAVKASPYGFNVCKLAQKNQALSKTTSLQQAGQLVQSLAEQYDILIADASINAQGQLPLPILNESEIIIQVSRAPESIKQAYTLIKLICSQLGRRSFGIIVNEADDEQAQIVFGNIQQVAKRYMQIDLEFFGAIPHDEELNRATKLGRTVVDAFPLAKASAAFSHIAKKLDDQFSIATTLKQASYR